MALQLKAHGILRVRPLLGGYDAWLAQALPLEPVPSTAPSGGLG